MRRAAVLVLASILAAGCSSEPTVIDGSTNETFAATIEAARRDLPVDQRLAFDAALRSPPGKRFADPPKKANEIARETYDGMTANEVVALNR